jgi:hypothetical protein
MNVGEIKGKIGSYVMDLGVDDVGFANIADYCPPSFNLESIFPEAQSIIVLAFKETFSCECPDNAIAKNARFDLTVFARSCTYNTARFIEKEFGIKTISLPLSYPLDASGNTREPCFETAIRQAAYTAGLGYFGNDGIIIHPCLGCRVFFAVIFTELDLPSDPISTQILSGVCDIVV